LLCLLLSEQLSLESNTPQLVGGQEEEPEIARSHQRETESKRGNEEVKTQSQSHHKTDLNVF